MISFLWAQDQTGVIGKNNQLPWRLPRDLKYFKETTMGHPIVMGRKTFESIGKALPGRINIILTRDRSFEAKDCLIFHSKDDLLQWIKEYNSEVFITGGSEIFRLFLDEVEKLYVTKIFHTFDGDVYFPDLDWSQWELVSDVPGIKDEDNPYHYHFQIYERKK